MMRRLTSVDDTNILQPPAVERGAEHRAAPAALPLVYVI